MFDELESFEAEVRKFQQNADLDFVDPGRLSTLVSSLQGTLSQVVHRAKVRGDHLLAGQSACTWVAKHLPDLTHCGCRPALRRRAAGVDAQGRRGLGLG